MGNLKINSSIPERIPTEWFRLKGSDVVYRRGPNGVCISENGVVSSVGNAYKDGGVYESFENSDSYERLYEGDQIVITL